MIVYRWELPLFKEQTSLKRYLKVTTTDYRILQTVKKKKYYLDRIVLLGLVSAAERCIFVLDEIQGAILGTEMSEQPSISLLWGQGQEHDSARAIWSQTSSKGCNLPRISVWPSDTRILSAHGPRTNLPGDLHAPHAWSRRWQLVKSKSELNTSHKFPPPPNNDTIGRFSTSFSSNGYLVSSSSNSPKKESFC